MEAHRIETVVTADGELTLTNLPVHAGDQVEVIVLLKRPSAEAASGSEKLRAQFGEWSGPAIEESQIRDARREVWVG